jgi:site-specific DNA-methyltransferase (adenine-specific)
MDNEAQVEIYNADSTDLTFLPPASVHLVVTSPPYNLGKDYGAARDDKTYQQYLDWTKQWGMALTHVLAPGSRVCINIPIDINLDFRANGRKTATKQAVLADLTQLFVHELGYIYNTTILWLERNVSRRTAWGSWLSASDPWVNTAAEAILVLSYKTRKRNGKGQKSDLERDDFLEWVLGLWDSSKDSNIGPGTDYKKEDLIDWLLSAIQQRWNSEGRDAKSDLEFNEFMNWMSGLWDFSGETSKRYGHPAAFPEELPRRLIKLFSFPGDTVLDPFLGSGTTCAVAKTLGRRAMGLDIDRHFCAIAANRCSQVALPLLSIDAHEEPDSTDDTLVTKALI